MLIHFQNQRWEFQRVFSAESSRKKTSQNWLHMNLIAMTVHQWDLLEFHTANVTFKHSVFFWFIVNIETLIEKKITKHFSCYLCGEPLNLTKITFVVIGKWSYSNWRMHHFAWAALLCWIFTDSLLAGDYIGSGSRFSFGSWNACMNCTHMMFIVRSRYVLFAMRTIDLNVALLMIQQQT